MQIGFIGLGIMGAPMAGHLRAAGHELFVATRSAVPQALRDAGAVACANAAEVARRAEVIFTMVPDTPDVEAVLFGDEGVAAGLSAGKTVVDMSSIDPLATKGFARRINELGCDYLDAPVARVSGKDVPMPYAANLEKLALPSVAEVVEVRNTPRGIKIEKVFIAADVGKVLDPINFENQVQGGVIWGLAHAINCELTYEDGIAQQANFDAFEGMRINQAPDIVVRALDNASPLRGIGEPPVPPAAPALANAIFAVTGKRIRELPLNKHIDFV